MANVRLTFDPEADAAYIYLVDQIEPGGSISQAVCDADSLRGDVVLDIDREGMLLGVEVLNASALLSPELLSQAERL